PSYYNSKYNLSGTINGDSLFLSEGEIIQGIINQSKGDFLLKMVSGELVGDTQINGNFNATLGLRRSSDFSNTEKSDTENAIAEYAAKYGSMLIGNTSKIDSKELLERVASRLKESDIVDFQNMHFTGSVTMAKLTFPLKMIASNSSQLYTEFEVQSQFFKMGNNGIIKWEYNPFEDVLEIDSVEENNSDRNSLSKFTGSLGQTLEDGFTIKEVREAKLDSIDAYRFLLSNAEEVRAFYISKDSEDLIRQEIDGMVELFFNYKWFDRLYFPSIYFKLDGKQDGRFDIDKVILDSDVDENIYNIPNELRHKIRTKKSAKDYYEEGIKLYNDNQFQLAKEQYDEAISLNSSRSSYFHERARTHLALNDYYTAVSDAQKAIELNPNNAKYYNTLGLAKYYLEDYKNSLKDFSTAIERDSTFGLAYYHKGLSFYKSGLKDSSFVYMSLAAEFDKSKSYIFLNHGIIGNEVGEFELARKSLKQAVSMGADTASTYNRIAVGFYGLGNYDSAKVYMDKVLEIDPENLLYRKNMGQTLYNLGDFEDAAEILEGVVKENDQDHSVFNFLGLCYYYMDDFDGAIYYYNKAILLNRDAVYFDNRAYAKIGVDKYSEAIEDFTRSIEIYPDDSEIFYQRGLLHELQHNQFDACKDFKRAIDIGHEEAENKFKEVCN
ncbi:MAG: tetratricopeptide repeat protein, partial [Ekhidna sp.]